MSLTGSENFIPNISGTTTRSIESSPRIMSPTTVLFLFANSRREDFVMLLLLAKNIIGNSYLFISHFQKVKKRSFIFIRLL